MFRELKFNDGFKQFLDHSRWLAALAVCTAHLRNLLFPDASDAGTLNIFAKIFYFLTLFGTQAVIIFFVVSGLLVGSSAFTKLKNGSFFLEQYAVDRMTRLYIVLVPAILLSLVLQWGGPQQTCQTSDSATTVVANLLFLQNLFAEPLCNNHPLWSLSSEAFFYLAAPVIFVTYLRPTLTKLAITVFIASVALLAWNGTNQSVAFGAMIWAIGLLPLFLRLQISFVFPLALFLLVLSASRLQFLGNGFTNDLLIGLAFGMTLCSRFPTSSRNAPLADLGRNGASFSYSLYLVHMPIAQAISFYIGKQSLPPQEVRSYLIYFASVALILAVAKFFGLFFESRTETLRRFVMMSKEKTV